MPLQRKLTLLLLCVGLALGAALFAYRLGEARSIALGQERDALSRSSLDLQDLRRSVEQYERARSHLGQEDGIARHERVALATSFAPNELPRLQALLTRAYEGDGFLLLRSFELAWQEKGIAGQAEEKELASGRDPAGGILTLSFQGEKIFTH